MLTKYYIGEKMMNKKLYLEELKDYFLNKNVIDSDVENIVDDYTELYDSALEHGLADEEIYKKLGSPDKIYQSLKDTLSYRYVQKSNRMVALSPFISIILFFILAYPLDLMEFSWMSFLLIPITAITFNVKGRSKFIAYTPFLSIILFLFIGFYFGAWHPGWLVFLLIPVTAILLQSKGRDKYIGLTPFIATAVYFLVSHLVSVEFYAYGYAVYAIIPLTALILTKPNDKKNILLIITIVVGVILQQVLYHVLGYKNIAWTPYLGVLGIAMLLNGITFEFGSSEWKTKVRPSLISGLVIVIIYLIVSFVFDDVWHWSWIILLTFPMASIFIHERFKQPVAYMPFLSVIIFMILGTFFGLWAYAWLVFLSIPMVAIITNEGKRIVVVKRSPKEEDDKDDDEE